MERIFEIKLCFGGEIIEFSFFDNQVLITVRTNKDMFETTSLFTPALSYGKSQEMVRSVTAYFQRQICFWGRRHKRDDLLRFWGVVSAAFLWTLL